MKKVLGILAVAFTFASALWATPKVVLEKNQVAVISKVKVNTKSNLAYFEKAFSCTEEDIARPSNYFFPLEFHKDMTTESNIVRNFERVEEAEDGEYTVIPYTIGSDRTIYMVHNITYLYHKIYSMSIFLPTLIKIKIPEGVNCIYIGDFNYTVEGDSFNVTNRKITDSFDAAVEFVHSVPGLEKAELVRVRAEPITKDDLPNIPDSNYVRFSGGAVHNLKNRVYTYQ